MKAVDLIGIRPSVTPGEFNGSSSASITNWDPWPHMPPVGSLWHPCEVVLPKKKKKIKPESHPVTNLQEVQSKE